MSNMNNIIDNYYKKYIKYKNKYVQLKNTQLLTGGKNNIKNYENNVLLDLFKVYKSFTKRKKIKNIYGINKKRKLSRTKVNYNKEKVYTMTDIKYNFDKKYELKEKYLEQYNYYMKNFILSLDLYKSGFYEHQFKLKQYLSDCGINRTTQLYGTCWFNTIMNAFIFGDHLRGRMVQLLLYYKNINGANVLDKIMKNIDKSKNKLKLTIKSTISNSSTVSKSLKDKIKFNIFEHILGIFYKVLCNEGLRNTERLIYDNFNLTNLALSIKILDVHKTINIKKMEDIAYVPIYGFDILINILNMFIDPKTHLTHQNYKIYNFNNNNHINKLFCYLHNDQNKSFIQVSGYYDITIKNVSFEFNDNGIKDYITFNNDGVNNYVDIYSISNVDFIFLDIAFYDMDKIPREINCVHNDKKYLFKLDVAILTLSQKNNAIAHAMTGIICDKKYYIYDSQNNFYFECDWTNLQNKKNKEQILNFFNIWYSKFINTKIEIEGTSNNFTQLYDRDKMNDFDIKCETIIYYNSNLDFSYDENECKRKRK